MDHGNVIIRFSDVTFGYDEDHLILDEANFSVRENAKFTVMGQNGAGKSTIFKLLTGTLKPRSGGIHIRKDASIATAHQVIPREQLDETVREYFQHAFSETQYDLDHRISTVLDIVNLVAPLNKKLNAFSGGQQSRLLLAYALIQEPDILLLDEPTNNLDQEGIDHLTGFLMMYPKTVLVISHDAEFLNAFTEGVLLLDVHTQKIEQYIGNYLNVVDEIAERIERDRMKNARLLKDIQDRKEKVNFFSHKGGKMRKLASKLRDQIEEAEEDMVGARRDDKAIRDFNIPAQPFDQAMATISSVKIIRNHQPCRARVDMVIRKGRHVLLSGPNGIGKSTLLRTLAEQHDPEARITEGVRVGYYRQDFSGLDFQKTAYDTLLGAMELSTADTSKSVNELLRSVAAQFLLTSNVLKNTVGSLSEGQKGLLCFATFVLQKPGLLLLDEPTNHMNFRHIPVIAKALDSFEGAMIVVSHATDFVNQIQFDEVLDMGSLRIEE